MTVIELQAYNAIIQLTQEVRRLRLLLEKTLVKEPLQPAEGPATHDE